MRIDPLLTDDAVMAEFGGRLTRARLARNMSQKQLAEEAGVGERTVARVEAGESPTLANVIRILRALDLVDGLDRLVPEPVVNPLVELEQRGRRRRRASPARIGKPRSADGGWTWGDGHAEGR
jgi:transcriptional regulator with XRE-family HTH domain